MCDSTIDILDRSQFLPKLCIGVKCIGTGCLSMEKIHLMMRTIYAVRSNMSSSKVSTITNHVRTCSDPMFTVCPKIPCTLIDSFLQFEAWMHLEASTTFSMRAQVSVVDKIEPGTCVN